MDLRQVAGASKRVPGSTPRCGRVSATPGADAAECPGAGRWCLAPDRATPRVPAPGVSRRNGSRRSGRAADPAPQAEADDDATAERADASAYALPDAGRGPAARLCHRAALHACDRRRGCTGSQGAARAAASAAADSPRGLGCQIAAMDGARSVRLLLRTAAGGPDGASQWVLGEIDATRFVATAQQIAVGVDADFDAPDVPRLVAQAAELDQLCARFDVQITLTVEATQGPLDRGHGAGGRGRGGVRRLGQGRWESRDERGEPVLALTAASFPTERLAVSIDVPVSGRKGNRSSSSLPRRTRWRCD